MPASSDYTLARLYIGFSSLAADTNGDDAFNAASGVCIGFVSANPATAFKVLRNDGSGATDVSSDPAGSSQATDTTAHEVRIVADEDNSRFSVKWDSNAYVHFTSEIPAASTGLGIVYQNETNDSGNAKTFRLYSFNIQSRG